MTGVSDHVLALWDARERWSGTITIPFAEAIERERKRTGRKGQGPELSTPVFNVKAG